MSGNSSFSTRLRSWLSQVDWPLLLFVAGATYVKLYVKLAAVALYALWLLRKKVRWSRPPGPALFYAAMPILGIVVAALHGSFGINGYSLGAGIGLMQWLAGGVTFYLLYVAALNDSDDRLLATIKAFFALNALATLVQFVGLMIEAKHPMPYWFYDSGLKYGASTGDHLKGIFMNNSLNNAAATLIGVLFFIVRGERRWTAVCVLVVMMCTSNMVIFGMMAVLCLLAIFGGNRRLRVSVGLMLLLTIGLYPVLSPQNFTYIKTVMSRLTASSKPFIAAENPAADTLISDEDTLGNLTVARAMRASAERRKDDSIYERMPQELIALREHSLHMDKPAWSYLTLEPAAIRPAFKRWYGVPPDSCNLAYYNKPLKIICVRQTISFLNQRPTNWLAGAGMGNFSSKLAIKMTGLGLQGSYPDSKVYIAHPFWMYHFYSLMYVLSRDIKEHSVVNMPANTYVQIFGEYGLLGFLLFALLYFGWLWLRSKNYKAGRWILVAMLGLFWLDYWYEMMTLTVVAEFCILYGIFGRSRPAANA